MSLFCPSTSPRTGYIESSLLNPLSAVTIFSPILKKQDFKITSWCSCDHAGDVVTVMVTMLLSFFFEWCSYYSLQNFNCDFKILSSTIWW